jgi:hypothetical protein
MSLIADWLNICALYPMQELHALSYVAADEIMTNKHKNKQKQEL